MNLHNAINFIRYECLSYQLPKNKQKFDDKKGEVLDFLENVDTCLVKKKVVIVLKAEDDAIINKRIDLITESLENYNRAGYDLEVK